MKCLPDTMEMLYLRTKKIDQILEKKVDNYTAMWEHKWKMMLHTDKQLREEVARIKKGIYPPPTNRDSFFGGRLAIHYFLHFYSFYAITGRFYDFLHFFSRTDVSILLWEKSENPSEYCIYRDIRSMYPFICRMGDFPTGRGEIISRGDFYSKNMSIWDIFGPISCSLDPPRGRLFPCIPVKMHSRLMFPLCRTCAQNMNQGTCTCTVEERRLEGCWTHIEIRVCIMRLA